MNEMFYGIVVCLGIDNNNNSNIEWEDMNGVQSEYSYSLSSPYIVAAVIYLRLPRAEALVICFNRREISSVFVNNS